MKYSISVFIILSLFACVAAPRVETPPDLRESKIEEVENVQTLVQKAPLPAVCAGEMHRQFDFWLGVWLVTTPDGKYAGKNSIKSILNGCALYESWTGASGYRGESINFYDRTRKQWHQSWIDYAGNPLFGDGGLQNGKMVLSGAGLDAAGNPIRNRITWTPNADGSVRQHWQSSTDNEVTWTTVFDGLYKKISE